MSGHWPPAWEDPEEEFARRLTSGRRKLRRGCPRSPRTWPPFPLPHARRRRGTTDQRAALAARGRPDCHARRGRTGGGLARPGTRQTLRGRRGARSVAQGRTRHRRRRPAAAGDFRLRRPAAPPARWLSACSWPAWRHAGARQLRRRPIKPGRRARRRRTTLRARGGIERGTGQAGRFGRAQQP